MNPTATTDAAWKALGIAREFLTARPATLARLLQLEHAAQHNDAARYALRELIEALEDEALETLSHE